MPFWSKNRVLEQILALSEAEKLHKTHADVQFLNRTHAQLVARRL